MTDPATGGDAIEAAPPSARRPLLSLTLAALAGWLCGLNGWCGFPLAAAAASLLLLITIVRARTVPVAWSLHAAAAAVALAHGALTAAAPAPNHLKTHLQSRRAFVEVIGSVADEPIQRDGETWLFPFRLEAIRKGPAWQTASGHAEIRMRAYPGRPPAYGERWRVAGLAVPLAGSPLAARIQTHASAERLAGDTGSRFHRWLIERRKAASAALGHGIRPGDAVPELGMLRALLLGERSDLDPSVRQAFARTGTLHIVAISGSHIAALMVLLVAVTKAFGRPRTTWILYAGPVLALYTLGTGMTASALRAGVMSLVLLAGPALRRRTDGATALSAAGLAILAVSPFQLQDRGFVLSFLIVGGLMLLYRPILNYLDRWLPGDPWQLEHPPAVTAVRWLARQFFALFAASLAAWLVSLPLTALFFNLFSPVGLVANLFVVPIAFVILLTGCLSFAASLVSPALTAVFNHANVVFVKAMLWVVDWFNALPGGYRFVEAPPIWAVVVYYVLLFACFLGRGRVRTVAVLASIAALGASVGYHMLSNEARIECWRNPGSMSVFLDLPRNRHVLVNTGRAFGGSALERALRARGVDELDALILTGASADVLGAASGLLAAVPAREVWIPDHAGRSPATESLLHVCNERGVAVRRLLAGHEGELAGGVQWQVLHPATGVRYRSAVAGGLVLRLARGPASMLLRGSTAEPDLLASSIDLDADVLIDLAGDPPSTDALLAAIRPLSVVAERDRYEQESPADAPGPLRIGLTPDDTWSARWPAPDEASDPVWATGRLQTRP